MQPAELAVDGLIIVQGLYGRLVGDGAGNQFNDDSVVVSSCLDAELDCIMTHHQLDVTVPLQCLVQDSQLHIGASSKVGLLIYCS